MQRQQLQTAAATITTTTVTTAATKQKYFLKFNTAKCDCCLYWLLLLLLLFCVVVVLALCKIFISFILKWRRRRRFTLHNFGASRELTRFLCSDKNWWHSALKEGGAQVFPAFVGLSGGKNLCDTKWAIDWVRRVRQVRRGLPGSRHWGEGRWVLTLFEMGLSMADSTL